MSFFNDAGNVDKYLELAEGYDGRELIERLAEYLSPGSTVLELGMGPGKDLEMLAERYVATGSDLSLVFLERFRAAHPEADLIQLDAETLETDRRFDAIYSNKVLQHLTRDAMRRSLERQASLLEPGGIAMHALWYGDSEEEHEGLLFVGYTEETIVRVVPGPFEIAEVSRYTEMEDDDSLLVVLRS